jgi:hypothetical protein
MILIENKSFGLGIFGVLEDFSEGDQQELKKLGVLMVSCHVFSLQSNVSLVANHEFQEEDLAFEVSLTSIV